MLGHRRLSGEKMEFKTRVKQILQNQGVPQTKVQESVVNGCSDVDLGKNVAAGNLGGIHKSYHLNHQVAAHQ